ncbi:MAG: hypothetical protein C6H99_02450 [Epsilonproteobacteria bacterium]|nr:hypothetical protein [Campylobacterota bacterium]NPA63722.1 hypothetical protein [Campylobacterota bacterium]
MKKNYWPHFIIALVAFAIALGVWTVKVAMDNPVELDNSYMMKYQQLDEAIYDLDRMKREFYRKYRLKFLTKQLSFPDAKVVFVITDKDGKPVKEAKVTVLFTRPFTTKQDIKVEARFHDGHYIATATLPAQGRWDVILRIELDGLQLYEKYRLSTQRVLKRIKT